MNQYERKRENKFSKDRQDRALKKAIYKASDNIMKADIQIDKGGHRYGKRYIERKRERRGQMDVQIREIG